MARHGPAKVDEKLVTVIEMDVAGLAATPRQDLVAFDPNLHWEEVGAVLSKAGNGDLNAMRDLRNGYLAAAMQGTAHPPPISIVQAIPFARLCAASRDRDDVTQLVVVLRTAARLLRVPGAETVAEAFEAEAINIIEQLAVNGDEAAVVASQAIASGQSVDTIIAVRGQSRGEH